MYLKIRRASRKDIPFMYDMLYEAVYWRKGPDIPSKQEAMFDQDFTKIVEDWGDKSGDTAVIAETDFCCAGAAWFRYWDKENNIRGYMDESVPVIVIGVQEDFRRQGIGTALMAKLFHYAEEKKIKTLSLCVSKDNHAINLYMKRGFKEYMDTGDSLIMVREL
jgi:ribosomal protein S18 acetylase RimI-like enzyme